MESISQHNIKFSATNPCNYSYTENVTGLAPLVLTYLSHRGRDTMSKVGGGGGGGSVFMKFTIYIHSEILHSSFDPLTTKFWGASTPPYQKVGGGGLKPPLPPRFSASVSVTSTEIVIRATIFSGCSHKLLGYWELVLVESQHVKFAMPRLTCTIQ